MKPVLAGQMTVPSTGNVPDAMSAAMFSGRRYEMRGTAAAPKSAARSGRRAVAREPEFGREELLEAAAHREDDVDAGLGEARDEALPVDRSARTGDAHDDAHPGMVGAPATPVAGRPDGSNRGAPRGSKVREGRPVRSAAMAATPVRSLRDFLDLLRARGDVVEITAEVDARLEIAEIHRRVVARGGPALLFRNVRGAAFPVVTNLFGTLERTRLSFGDRPRRFVEHVVEAAHTLVPPSFGKLWKLRGLAMEGLKVGMKSVRRGPVCEVEEAPDLERLPALTSWHSDGGPFLTLPLVYTESPATSKHNLGMYRMQVHSKTTTGMHFQIHKGGGFHHHEAERLGQGPRRHGVPRGTARSRARRDRAPARGRTRAAARRACCSASG